MAWSNLDTTPTGNAKSVHISDHAAIHADLNAEHGVQATIFVDAANGNDANGGKTWGDAKKTINSGIAAINTQGGGTLELSKGTHTVATSPDIILVHIKVVGQGNETVIDVANAVTCFDNERTYYFAARDFQMNTSGTGQGSVGMDIRGDNWNLSNIYWFNWGKDYTVNEEVWETGLTGIDNTGTNLLNGGTSLQTGDFVICTNPAGSTALNDNSGYWVEKSTSANWYVHAQKYTAVAGTAGSRLVHSGMTNGTFSQFNRDRPWPFAIRSAGGTWISDWGMSAHLHMTDCYGGPFMGPGNGLHLNLISRRHKRGCAIYIERGDSLLNARYTFYYGHSRVTSDMVGGMFDSDYAVVLTNAPGAGSYINNSMFDTYYSEGAGSFPATAHFYLNQECLLDNVQVSAGGGFPVSVTSNANSTNTVVKLYNPRTLPSGKTGPTGTFSNIWYSRVHPEEFTTGGRPAATLFPRGYEIWNTTTKTKQYSDGTSWV